MKKFLLLLPFLLISCGMSLEEEPQRTIEPVDPTWTNVSGLPLHGTLSGEMGTVAMHGMEVAGNLWDFTYMTEYFAQGNAGTTDDPQLGMVVLSIYGDLPAGERIVFHNEDMNWDSHVLLLGCSGKSQYPWDWDHEADFVEVIKEEYPEG